MTWMLRLSGESNFLLNAPGKPILSDGMNLRTLARIWAISPALTGQTSKFLMTRQEIFMLLRGRKVL